MKRDRGRLTSSAPTMKTATPVSSKPKEHDRLEQLQADHELFLQAFESELFSVKVTIRIKNNLENVIITQCSNLMVMGPLE